MVGVLEDTEGKVKAFEKIQETEKGREFSIPQEAFEVHAFFKMWDL